MIFQKIAVCVLTHLAVLVCFPDTGPAGSVYLWSSIFIWAMVLAFIAAPLELIKATGGFRTLLSNAVFAAIVALPLVFTLPQADGKSIASKLKSCQFPTQQTVRKGLRRISSGEVAEIRRLVEAGIHKIKK